MTTATAIETKNNDAPFSYAAAASGKSKPSKSGSATPVEARKPTESVKPSDSSKTSVNGEPPATSKNEALNLSAPVNGVASDSKSTTQPQSTESNPVQGETVSKDEDTRSTTASEQEPAGSTTGGDDGDSRSGKEVGSDGKTKFKNHNLVDAPIPKQNPWTIRKEAFDRTKALQAETKKPQPAVNGSLSQDRASQTYNNEKRHNRQKSNVSDNRTHQATSGRRDTTLAADKRGTTDASRDGKGLPLTDDGASRGPRPGRNIKAQQEDAPNRDVSTSQAPPSLSDTSLWPTPEVAQVAQDEEKREKRERDEKEKPATTSGRPAKDKWISIPVTPNIIYDTPLPSRGGRSGRGGRTERGGRTGQPSSRPSGEVDAATTPTDLTSRAGFDKPQSSQVPSEPRATQGAPVDARPRRPANAPSPQTENPSAEALLKKDTNDTKKDAVSQLANGILTTPPVDDSSSKDRKPSQSHDDGAFVGQGVLPPSALRPKAEKPGVFPSNRDQPTQGRGGYPGAFGSHKPETDLGHSTHGPRDRPAGRGGYRGGRGDNNSFISHSNSRFNGGNSIRHHSPPSQINTNPHQPRQSPQYPSSPSTPQNARNYRGNGRSQGVQQSQQFGKYGMQNGFPPQSPYAHSPGFHYPYYTSRNAVGQAVPFQPDYEYAAAVQNVVNQLSYYFSLDNMVKDTFLRGHMDSQGWIFLDVIAGFRKVKDMTKDNIAIVREACIQSPAVEFRGYHPDGRERLRPAHNPTEWVLKYEDRDESCRHEGPNWDARYTHGPPFINAPPFPMYYQNPNVPPMAVPGPVDQQFVGYNGYPQQNHVHSGFIPGQEFVPENGATYGNGFMPPYQPFAQGQDQKAANGNAVDEAALQNDHKARSHKKFPTVDEFSDDNVNQLVLVTRRSDAEVKQNTDEKYDQSTPVMVSDKFNDALVRLEQDAGHGSEGQKPKDTDDHLVKFYPTSPRLGPAAKAQPQPHNDEVGWFVDPGTPEEGNIQAPGITIFQLYSYPEFKNKVLSRREKDGAAHVPELDTLYRFYSHFLRKHFNLNMYNEFKSLALEDFHNNCTAGIDYLYKFHVFKIQDFPTPDLIFQDFASLASEQNERPPYDKKMVDAVGLGKSITNSTKTRLGKFMQEKNKNFQMWPMHESRHHHHHHHHHHHNHTGNHNGHHNNHNNHGHQTTNHTTNGPAIRT
ncbi:hypothetical protein ABW19_dt0208357 [Dactylella cylindrospora]|nr:hypothetical protein ABW19_dt0208357 [Dactylella cylindrospora]